MIPLGAHGKPSPNLVDAVIGRITSSPVGADQRADCVFRADAIEDSADIVGYAGALCRSLAAREFLSSCPIPLVHSIDTSHLADGDVVSMDLRGYVRTLYRKGSLHNVIFATDRCNSLCLMCSQPPKKVDDQWRMREHLRLIKLIDPDTKELGITGGEPTLLKDGLVEIIKACKEFLPNTAVHVLSNGRLFYYGSYAKRLAEVRHPDLMIGIPLYSDIDSEHDYVVQARGAFDETLIGLQNLGRYGVPVEIRVVVHRLTYERLPQLAEFIYRNVTFASHVAFMGLELTGFTLPNLDLLWIDPWDYRAQLSAATLYLISRGMNASVYNHQLCTVPESLWPYCRRSISDWKNEYLPLCAECGVRDQCGGFFASGVQRRFSGHIRPIPRGSLLSINGKTDQAAAIPSLDSLPEKPIHPVL